MKSIAYHGETNEMMVSASEIEPHPMNARIGHIPSVVESIRNNGVYRPIYVQKSTGYIIAGTHLYLALTREFNQKQVPVAYRDVDDDQAKRIMLADNRSSELGSTDNQLLAELLSEFDNLDGTAYTPYDLENLANLIEGTDDQPLKSTKEIADEEWEGMPEFISNDETAHRTIKVHFTNDSDVESFAKLIGQNITERTKYLWHPKVERENTENIRYVATN